MKKLMCLLLIILVCLVGCTPVECNDIFLTNDASDISNTNFGYYNELYEDGFRYKIVVDPETKVMYHYSKDSGMITPLLNSDGSLKLYQ